MPPGGPLEVLARPLRQQARRATRTGPNQRQTEAKSLASRRRLSALARFRVAAIQSPPCRPVHRVERPRVSAGGPWRQSQSGATGPAARLGFARTNRLPARASSLHQSVGYASRSYPRGRLGRAALTQNLSLSLHEGSRGEGRGEGLFLAHEALPT